MFCCCVITLMVYNIMSNDYPKKLTEQDKERLYQKLNELRTGDGSEVAKTTEEIDRILKKYGGSLHHVAENPERLLGEGDGNKSDKYVELSQKFQEVVQANGAFKDSCASKAEEIETLKAEKAVYILNPFRHVTLERLIVDRQYLKEGNNLLEEEVTNLMLENEQLKLGLERVKEEIRIARKGINDLHDIDIAEELQLFKHSTPHEEGDVFNKLEEWHRRNILLKHENSSLKHEKSAPEAPNKSGVFGIFNSKPPADGSTIKSKGHIESLIFAKYSTRMSRDEYKHLGSDRFPECNGFRSALLRGLGDVEKMLAKGIVFSPGALNVHNQTELAHLCFTSLRVEYEEEMYFNESRDLINKLVDRFIGEGGGVPDIKTKDKFGYTEPQLVAQAASPDRVEAYLKRVGCLVDIPLEHMLAFTKGDDLHKMADLYVKYSSDALKAKSEMQATDELCRIIKNILPHSKTNGVLVNGLERLGIMNIYSKLSRQVTSYNYCENGTAVTTVMNITGDYVTYPEEEKVMFEVLKKFHELGGRPAKDSSLKLGGGNA